MKKNVFFIILGLLLFASCEKDNMDIDDSINTDDKIDWNIAANKSTNSLINSFWNKNENYFNYSSNGNTQFHYWPQAHALDVLIDAYERTSNNEFKIYFDLWFEGVKKKNGNSFYNNFYDDMEWNALAILRAYEATNDTKYKEAALQIWEYIKVGWNDNAGGGISWVKGQEYSKNACSNAPAAILAARLYQKFGDENNKEWAVKIYNWQKNTLFNNSNGAVYDNINSQTGKINKEWIFTYNQGTFIGAAVELHKIFNEKAYLKDATLAANYTTGSLVDNSILKSEGTGDGGLFKGIFIRYLTELVQQDRLDIADKKRFIQFLKYNAETLWTDGTNPSPILYGPNWKENPGSSTGLTEQLSGCMLIETMAHLEKEDLL